MSEHSHRTTENLTKGVFIKVSRVERDKQNMVKAPGRTGLKMESEGEVTKHRGSCHCGRRLGRGFHTGTEGLGAET